jgi:hypothetical protein
MLQGQGLAPAALQPDPGSHDFGGVVQGGTSAGETFTITNTGKAQTGPLTVYLNGTNKDQFTLGKDTCSGGQLAGGATCTVSVTFTPNANASGPLQARLNVRGTPGGTVSASLSGTSETIASLSIGPTPYDYGNVAQKVATTPVTFTVTNGGTLPSGSPTVTKGGANPDDFMIAADNCTGHAVAGNNGTCTISVAFKPSTQAPESATLTVAASPGGAVTANLSGTGAQAASLLITPSPFGFSDVVQTMPSPNKTFTVSNTGGVPSGAVVMSMAGMYAPDFHILTNNCRNKTLPANGATVCTVIAYFKPSMVGHETATLTAVANPGGTATSALDGNGVTQGTLAVMPNPGAFNGVNKGTTSPKITFHVSNNGGAPSGVPMVSITPGMGVNQSDFAQTNNCTAAIPANTMDACQINVTFTPSSTMDESATLNIAAMPGGTTVPLTGTGTLPSIATMPGSQGFTALPGQMQSYPFTVKNNGTGPTGALSVAIPMPNNGFSIQSESCSTLPFLGAGATCPVTVQYSPPVTEALGTTDKATLTVGDAFSAMDNSSAMLTGTAEASGVNLVMTSSPMPAVYSGSGTVTFTVTNWGATASGKLAMPTFTATQTTMGDLNANFAVANDTCTNAMLSAGGVQPCKYDLVFTAPTSNSDAGSEAGAQEGGTTGGTFSGTTGVSDGTNSASGNFSGSF